MKIELTKYERMLLELLRAALNEIPAETSIFEDATQSDWKSCYKFAVEQGTMALAWDGITTLPSSMMPPVNLKIKWALEVEAYEKRYLRYCKVANEISDFYKQHGIGTLLLKGVGFSKYYPKPEHREGGDIDIYTFSTDKIVMSDHKANELADELMRKKNIPVEHTSEKHTSFFYQRIPIENHKHFLDVHLWEIAKPIEEQLLKVNCPKSIFLLKDRQEVLVPSESFNTLFISFHAMLHYSFGLCLHHLCDWACQLNRCGLSLPSHLNDKYYLNFVYSLTAFTNQYLGTSIDVPYNEEALNKMMFEMFRSPYRVKPQLTNPLKIIKYKIGHFIYYSKRKKEIANISFFRSLCETLHRLVKKPIEFIKI